MDKRIILASTSPRRIQIMKNLGIPFEAIPSTFEENINHSLSPSEVVQELALGKAVAVAENLQNAIVIGADTVVQFEGKIYGKPKDEEDAKRTLMLISGKTVEVITGFVIIDTDSKKTLSRAIVNEVVLKHYDKDTIEKYVATGEPMDKAGSFTIQNRGSILIDTISGDYLNALGLPISHIADGLLDFGVNLWDLM